MRNLSSLLFCSLILLLGCGPLAVPMVDRPSEEKQAKIDITWNRALDPPDKLSRQEWLDLFVGAQAFQMGVDKLHFRSEKSLATGRIVMEVHYDRASPNEDRFDVRVFDNNDHLLREETYSRDDVENTIGDLFRNSPNSNQEEEWTPKEKEVNQRWEKILSYFPDAKEKKTLGEAEE